MIEVKNIDKYFHRGQVSEFQLFDNFNLTVDQGDFVSIIGSNGSGKSTLLNLICGSLKQDSGQITIDGKVVDGLADYERYQTIARVFQDPSLATSPNMTLLENLSMADNKGGKWGLTAGVNKGRIEDYRQMLAELDLNLENKLDDKVSALSGGQRQAVALLMANLSPVKYLVLDEHTAALDPKTSDLIMELTDKLIKDKGLTVLMVTHNLKHSLKYGNRLLMMHEGEIILDAKDKDKENLELDQVLDQFYEISIERGNSV